MRNAGFIVAVAAALVVGTLIGWYAIPTAAVVAQAPEQAPEKALVPPAAPTSEPTAPPAVFSTYLQSSSHDTGSAKRRSEAPPPRRPVAPVRDYSEDACAGWGCPARPKSPPEPAPADAASARRQAAEADRMAEAAIRAIAAAPPAAADLPR